MYIQDLHCISPQQTQTEPFFSEPLRHYTGNKYIALEPDYAPLIPAGLLRRTGKAVKMGLGAALPLLKKYPDLDGIVIATSAGGIEDSMKFLTQIVDYEEGTLTPTHFVQSTPNSLAGMLAILSKNTGYNTTHSNKSLSFEAALQDALLLFQEGACSSLLVGNTEQFSQHNYNIESLESTYKTEPVDSDKLLKSGTSGTVCGEGAAMFVVSKNPAEALAQISDVGQISSPGQEELHACMVSFLASNQLVPDDIDTLVLGFNGDQRYDFWYSDLISTLFPSQSVISFKNLVGEYPTASAFAVWLSTMLLSGQKCPAEALYKKGMQPPKNLLIYNHSKGIQHGFILLRKAV
ncbi:MAG TPA: beta-ketoacyl synthase chain length factor [Bacteroidia bacterium]|jgi:3-oxoacyl-(acyl-carrier-protein) synthase|nr:beta-ketoacyl synthase chain length factor [Bacteroidia bacterium]